MAEELRTTIDLRGIDCPTNLVQAMLALENVPPGEVVEVLIDEGEAAAKLPRSLKGEGHRLLQLAQKDGHRLLTLERGGRAEKDKAVVSNFASTMFTRNGRLPALDPVMVEETVELIVNGARLSSIVTTPELHKELAVGYLVTEGRVKGGDIEEIVETPGRVFLKVSSFDRSGLRHELRSSGCIGIDWEREDEELLIPVGQSFRIDVLLDSLSYLDNEIQRRTGGAHSASLIDADGNLRHKAIDIGRHNAIDKVVGMAVLKGEDLSGMFLLTSGRQPAGMVMKAARAGIPLIVTKGAPASSGIESARRSRITLCCFADAEKLKVFSVPERISVTA